MEAHLSQATATTDQIEPLRAIWIQGIRWGNRLGDSCKYGEDRQFQSELCLINLIVKLRER